MRERTIKISNKAGIHARPAALLVKTASSYQSSVFFEKDNERVNGKSIMGVITLGAAYETELKIIVDGIDEEAALAALLALFESGFQEQL